MTEHELFRKTFSTLHASPDTLMEVQKAMENNKKTHRTLRRGVVIAIAAALMLTVAAGVIWSLTQGGETPPLDGDGDGDSDASSIVNIFKTEKTTIPRVKGEAGVSLVWPAARS